MKPIDISDFVFDDDAVCIDNVLIIADTHLGRTDKQAYSYPEPEYEEIYNRVTVLCDKYEPETVVVAGDVFQKHDVVPKEAVRVLHRIREYIELNGGELVLIPGNHDEQTVELEKVFNGVVKQNYRFTDEYGRDVVVLHGHKTPVKTGDVFVIGHLHPVKKHRGEFHDCYLFSDDAYYGSAVIILPAFTNLITGSDVGQRNFNPDLIPVLADGEGIDAFRSVLPVK